MSAASGTLAGVELGGTKCVVILARGPGEVIAREMLPTTSPDETLGRIEDILRAWQAKHRFAALGIGSFGPLDVDPGSPRYGRISNTPKAGWQDARVYERLAGAAGVPTALDTDVNGAALAEMRWGCARRLDDFAYVTVGTGVGVGLIVGGRPTRGFAHCELGHIRIARLPGDEFKGSCPYHGDCVEGLASGPSIEARVGHAIAGLPPDHPAWNSAAWALSQLCQAIVCAAAPRAIAIGGGVVGNHQHLLPRIEAMLVQSLNGYLELPANKPYVLAPALGNDAGPLGSIALATTVLR